MSNPEFLLTAVAKKRGMLNRETLDAALMDQARIGATKEWLKRIVDAKTVGEARSFALVALSQLELPQR